MKIRAICKGLKQPYLWLFSLEIKSNYVIMWCSTVGLQLCTVNLSDHMWKYVYSFS